MTTPFKSKRWKPLAARIIQRDGHRCQIRGDRCTTTATDVDHVWSWRLGERFWFDPSNLRASCPQCNRGRRTELVVAGPDLLPAGVTAAASEVVLADIAFGKVWLFDVEDLRLRDPVPVDDGAAVHAVDW